MEPLTRRPFAYEINWRADSLATQSFHPTHDLEVSFIARPNSFRRGRNVSIECFPSGLPLSSHIWKLSGVLSEWNRLGSAVAWANGARTSGLSFDQVQSIFSGDNLRQLANIEDEIGAIWAEIEPLDSSVEEAGTVQRTEIMATRLEDLMPVLSQWHAWLEVKISPLQALDIKLSLKDLAIALQEWTEIDRRKDSLLEDTKLKACLGDEAAGVATDWTRIQATQDWIDEMVKVGIPRPWMKAMLQVESQALWAEIVQLITQAAGVWDEIHRTFSTFEPHLGNATTWLKSTTPRICLKR